MARPPQVQGGRWDGKTVENQKVPRLSLSWDQWGRVGGDREQRQSASTAS